MIHASSEKTYLITPLRKEAPMHIVSFDDRLHVMTQAVDAGAIE
jgi:hypothetical protein